MCRSLNVEFWISFMIFLTNKDFFLSSEHIKEKKIKSSGTFSNIRNPIIRLWHISKLPNKDISNVKYGRFFLNCVAFSKYLYFIQLFVKHAMSNFAASSMKTTLSFDNESFAFWLQFQHSEPEFKILFAHSSHYVLIM